MFLVTYLLSLTSFLYSMWGCLTPLVQSLSLECHLFFLYHCNWYLYNHHYEWSTIFDLPPSGLHVRSTRIILFWVSNFLLLDFLFLTGLIFLQFLLWVPKFCFLCTPNVLVIVLNFMYYGCKYILCIYSLIGCTVANSLRPFMTFLKFLYFDIFWIYIK